MTKATDLFPVLVLGFLGAFALSGLVQLPSARAADEAEVVRDAPVRLEIVDAYPRKIDSAGRRKWSLACAIENVWDEPVRVDLFSLASFGSNLVWVGDDAEVRRCLPAGTPLGQPIPPGRMLVVQPRERVIYTHHYHWAVGQLHDELNPEPTDEKWAPIDIVGTSEIEIASLDTRDSRRVEVSVGSSLPDPATRGPALSAMLFGLEVARGEVIGTLMVRNFSGQDVHLYEAEFAHGIRGKARIRDCRGQMWVFEEAKGSEAAGRGHHYDFPTGTTVEFPVSLGRIEELRQVRGPVEAPEYWDLERPWLFIELESEVEIGVGSRRVMTPIRLGWVSRYRALFEALPRGEFGKE